MQELGLSGNSSAFINTSLCPYYRMLWSDCKRLHDLGKISNFYISSGTIKVKIFENRNPISILHTKDFVKYFLKLIYYQPRNVVTPQNLFLWRLYDVARFH